MDQVKHGPPPWITPVISIAAFVVMLIWDYIQMRHWKEPGIDAMALAINIAVALLASTLLAVAVIRNVRDTHRAKSLRAQIITIKDEHAVQVAKLAHTTIALPSKQGDIHTKITLLKERAREIGRTWPRSDFVTRPFLKPSWASDSCPWASSALDWYDDFCGFIKTVSDIRNADYLTSLDLAGILEYLDNLENAIQYPSLKREVLLLPSQAPVIKIMSWAALSGS